MSITVVDGSCLLSCYFNGNLMPNPAPFLWTVVPVNLTSCKLVEHTLAVPMSSSQMWMLWTDVQVSTVWEFVYILPIGPSLIMFKVVIKKTNSSLTHTQKKILRPPDILCFQTLGLYRLILREKRREFPRKDCLALGTGSIAVSTGFSLSHCPSSIPVRAQYLLQDSRLEGTSRTILSNILCQKHGPDKIAQRPVLSDHNSANVVQSTSSLRRLIHCVIVLWKIFLLYSIKISLAVTCNHQPLFFPCDSL